MQVPSRGRAQWCYTVNDYGVDTVRVVGGTGTPGEDVLFIELYPPPLSLSSAGNTEDLNLVPGETVCSNSILDYQIEGLDIAFRVYGANPGASTAATGANGRATWCYTPAAIGIDTVIAFIGNSFAMESDTLVYSLDHPAISFDPANHQYENNVLVVPGSDVCADFILDRNVTDHPVGFGVRGVNTASDSKTVSGSGVQFCYTTNEIGIDTLTASLVFDFGGESYTTRSTMLFETYIPVLSVDDDVHTFPDTLLIDPDGMACAVFRTTPPISNVRVVGRIRGVNSANVERWTDAEGRAVICYPASNEGIDAITATAYFEVGGASYADTTLLVAVLVDGSALAPAFLTVLTPRQLDSYWTIFVIDSNKPLAELSGDYWFRWNDGGPVTNSLQFYEIGGSEWQYAADIMVTGHGFLEIVADAVDTYGYRSWIEASYDVGVVRKSYALNFRTIDGAMRLVEPSSLTRQNGALIVSRDRAFGNSPLDIDGNSLIPASERFNIKAGVRFEYDPMLTLRYDFETPDIPDPERDARKIGLYRPDGDRWEYVGGEGAGGSVFSVIEELGVYAAFFNAEYYVVPVVTALHQNYPNPFNPATTIAFELATDGDVEVTVYGVSGKRVKRLTGGFRPAGIHEVQWDGSDESGAAAASGIYFCRMTADDVTETKKMVLLR